MVTKTEEKVRTQSEAAELKRSDAAAEAATWHARLWGDTTTAVTYANANPISQAGTIEFNVMDNGQVWTFALV